MVFISASSSCKDTEIPYQLLYSIRANTTDKNTGVLGTWGDGWEVAVGQHIKKASTSSIQCKNKSIEDPCTLQPDMTWKKMTEGNQIYLVRGKDRHRPAWHYVLLVDDDETIQKFHASFKMGKVDVADYGQVLESGWGEDPPNQVKDRFERTYNIIYN